MGSNSIRAAREAALAKVQSGEWSASQAYQADRSGAFTRGMFEPVEAQAKAAGAGQWRSASQADRQAAASFTPSQRQPSQATQRARAAGINPFGYNGATDASGRAVDNRPARGMLLPGSKASGYSLMDEGMPSHFSPEMMKRFSSVAPPGYSASDVSWGQDYGPTPGDAAISREQAAAQDRTGSLNSSATYRTASGGVVDPTLDQRAKFNPNTNPNYRPPVDSTPMNGANNNNVGKLTPPPLPTRSNYAGVQNRFDDTYTGRLLAQAKDRAAQQYKQTQADIQSRMAQRGLTQAGTPGLEEQLMREAEVAYGNNFNQLATQAQLDSAGLASNFDMQRAGALDAFDMNRGNLALGYSADARAGMLLPAQVRAANAGAGSAESQALIDNQNAYEYGLQERANNRGARDNFQTQLAGTQYEGASVSNAIRVLDFNTQKALLETTIKAAKAQGAIQDSEADAARQILAQGGQWYENPLFKNILRGLLVAGGAAAGSLIPGVGTAAGALAGVSAAGAIK